MSVYPFPGLESSAHANVYLVVASEAILINCC